MRKMSATLALLALVALPAAVLALDTNWNVDAAHSEVGFSVRHFFTPVTGSFGDYEVDLVFDPADPSNSSVSAVIQVASIDTGVDGRNQHLMSGDFFEAERFPEITFMSTSVRSTGDSTMIATGELTIKDTTRTVDLEVELLGIQDVPEQMQSRMGAQVAGFRAALVIDRNDFGVGVGNWAETAVVGSEVTIDILVEANQR